MNNLWLFPMSWPEAGYSILVSHILIRGRIFYSCFLCLDQRPDILFLFPLSWSEAGYSTLVSLVLVRGRIFYSCFPCLGQRLDILFLFPLSWSEAGYSIIVSLVLVRGRIFNSCFPRCRDNNFHSKMCIRITNSKLKKLVYFINS